MNNNNRTDPSEGATISDVAAIAGVSVRTVSRVVNQSPLVNGETRQRVTQAIEQLNFRPSLRARALAMRRSFLIGMVHNDRNALVLDAVLRGVVEAANAHNYELVVHPTPAEGEQSIADVLNFVRQSRVDGLVVLPPISGIEGLAEALAGAKISAVALSSVALNGYVSIVLSEERRAAADVGTYLVKLGHQRIAMITGPLQTISARERRDGFVEALKIAGMAVPMIAEGDYGFQSGVNAAERLLSGESPPTAIFASNDVMAAGVLKVAAARGISVPRELSVVGFDGSLLAKMLTPALTTVVRPFGEMAHLATERLIAFLDAREAPVSGHTDLHLRESESSGQAPN